MDRNFTKKDFLNKYDSKIFIRHIENFVPRETQIKNNTKAALERGYTKDQIVIEDNKISIKDTKYFMMLEQRKQNQLGKMTFRSKDYIFNFDNKNHYGEIPSFTNFTENSFYIVDFAGNKIKYTAIEDNLYKITNDKNDESYLKVFQSEEDARHFVVNCLDLSLNWSINKVDVSSLSI